MNTAQESRGSAAERTRPIPTTAVMVRQFLRFGVVIRAHWGGVIKSVALSLALALLGMVVPYVSKLLVDRVYPARDVGLSHVLIACLCALMLGSTWVGALQSYFSKVVAARLSSATALMFFNHLQHLPAAFFDTHEVGEVLSRVTDVRSGVGALANVLETLATSSVYLVVVPPFLVLLNWKLALLAVVVFPLTMTVATATSRRLRGRHNVAAEASAALGAYQLEVLSHIRILKTMAMESSVYRRVDRQTHAAMEASLRAARLHLFVSALNASLGVGGNVVFMWYAWRLILTQELTLGSFFAFSAYLGYVTGALSRAGMLFDSLQQASIWLARMFEYLELPPEQRPALSYRPLPPVARRLRGDIGFHGVSCGYGPGSPVLADLHVSFREGGLTAIVGASGAGKSTLLRLIPRLIDPEKGRVTIGGTDVRDVSLPDLRRQIAVVWQETALLRGTLLENLVPDGASVSQSRLEEAIEVCQLTAVIARLPRGLETPIGEWGTTVSGGQRQRIAIARALLRNAPILLLDESMANLDADTEAAVLTGLRARFGQTTILLVTHRVAVAAEHADHICAIDAGRVVAPADVAPACAVDWTVPSSEDARGGRRARLEPR